MQQTKGNLLTRSDTMLGVCEGLGEDLGVPSNLFRIALALTLFWSPTAAVAAYAIGAVIVLASRLLFPSRRASPVTAPATTAEPHHGDNDDTALPVAAAA